MLDCELMGPARAAELLYNGWDLLNVYYHIKEVNFFFRAVFLGQRPYCAVLRRYCGGGKVLMHATFYQLLPDVCA